MQRILPVIILICYFFSFFLPDVNFLYMSWDRKIPQYLFISLLNLFSFIYFFRLEYSINNLLKRAFNNKIIVFYSLFIFACLISIMFAINLSAAITTFSQYLTYLIALIFIYSWAIKINNIFIELVIFISILSLTIETFSIVYNALDLVYIKEINFTRDNFLLRTFAGNINISANSIIMKIVFLYYALFKMNDKKYLVLLYTILFIAFSALFILLTRSSFVSLAMITVLYFLWKSREGLMKTVNIVLIFLLSFSFVQYGIIKTNNSEITDRLSSISINRGDDSINERLNYYSHSLESISENPLFGIGIGNWKLKSIYYDSQNIGGYIIPYHAHNDFLQIAAEIGILGFLMFLMIFIIPMWEIILRLVKRNLESFEFSILLIMIAYIIDSMLNFPIARPLSHVYFLFVLVSYVIFKQNKTAVDEDI
ncbi:MAG: O-antigen ligase family protein [Bacteroidota bacterium]|nr:O-antigen ligase family protein [Bacteroidota bacterium]